MILGAHAQSARLGEFDQAVSLARSKLGDDLVRHMRRSATVHNQPERPRCPMGSVPLQLNHDEGIAREKRRGDLDAAALPNTLLA